MGQPTQPSNVDIDPNAGRPMNPYGTVGEPALSGPPPAPAQVSNPATVAPTAPALGQAGAGGQYTVDQILAGSDQELNQANQDVAKLWDQIRPLQQQIQQLQNDPATIANPAKLTAATSSLNSLYSSLSQAMQRVETANASRQQTLQKAIDSNQLTPSQVDLAKAQTAKAGADADLARTQGDVLQQGSQGQRDLVAAQAGLASQQGLLQKAQADAVNAKTPAEKAQLEAQANALQAQANQTNTLLPGLVEKQKAETGLTVAQTDLTGSQSELAKAQAGQAGANATLAQAQADALKQTTPVNIASTQATTAATQAGVQKDLLGGLYGLQDKVNAIRQVQNLVFGPGGSGDPGEANDLLQQYVTASISGTTPYEANVAAANAGLTAFGTQASLANAAQAAAASRANAYTGFGGSALGTLAQMNANAPAGSTAMAGAFGDVMNQMQQRLQAPQFAGPTMPTAPQLPALLQKLAPGAAGAPGAAMPAGPPLPGPAAAPQTSAPVTINIGGAQPQTLPQMPQTQTTPGFNFGAMPGAGPQGQQSTPLPGVLQQHAPADMNTIGQLWGNEIQSGLVRSPYAAMGAQ